MSLIKAIIVGNMIDMKEMLFERLDEIFERKMSSFKKVVAEDFFEDVEVPEDVELNEANVIKMGRVKMIRMRVRRRGGKMVVQRRVKRSAVKGYTLRGGKGLGHQGAKLVRITARQKIRMRLSAKRGARKRRGKMQMIKRKRALSMRKRKSLGLR